MAADSCVIISTADRLHRSADKKKERGTNENAGAAN